MRGYGFLVLWDLRGVCSVAINYVMTNTETVAEQICQACKLPARMCDVPNTLEQHPILGLACFACRDTEDTAVKIIRLLNIAPSKQLNQTTIARKLGRKPSSINRACWMASHRNWIERPYKNVHEKPSATTYKLTGTGEVAVHVRRS